MENGLVKNQKPGMRIRNHIQKLLLNQGIHFTSLTFFLIFYDQFLTNCIIGFRRSFLDNNVDLPKELKQLFTPLKCQLCNCEMGSAITAKGHYEGKKHVSNIKKWFTDHPELAGKYKVPEINRNVPFVSISLSKSIHLFLNFLIRHHQTYQSEQYIVNLVFLCLRTQRNYIVNIVM